MRKVIVLEHISLDRIIQAPGGSEEDTSGCFAYDRWIAPYSDAILGTAHRRQMNLPFDLLLGRKTFKSGQTQSQLEADDDTRRVRRLKARPG